MTSDAIRIWRNKYIPVVYKPQGKDPLLVRVPYAPNNRDWLLSNGRSIAWIAQFKAWEIPRSRFNEVVELCLDRWLQVYIIEAYRELEKCAPACWNATGYDCECSCMGANHGSGQPLDHVVSDTFAFEWKERQLACRLVQRHQQARAG